MIDCAPDIHQSKSNRRDDEEIHRRDHVPVVSEERRMAGEILCDVPAQHESDSGSGREYPMWLDGRGRRRQAQQFRGGPKLRTHRDAREAIRAEE